MKTPPPHSYCLLSTGVGSVPTPSNKLCKSPVLETRKWAWCAELAPGHPTQEEPGFVSPLRLLRSFPLSNFSDPSFLIGFLEKEEAAKDLLYYTGRNTFTRHPLQ